jgi:hypothetical protein
MDDSQNLPNRHRRILTVNPLVGDNGLKTVLAFSSNTVQFIDTEEVL